MAVQGFGPSHPYHARSSGSPRKEAPRFGSKSCLAGCTCCCIAPVGILAGGVYLVQRMVRKGLGRLKT